MQAMPTVTVRARVPGGTHEPLPDVFVESASDRLCLRQLIQRAVEEQLRDVAAGRARKSALDKQYLTDSQIRTLTPDGGARLSSDYAWAVPDPTIEVDRAVRAFADGTCAVFVGGERIESLDEDVTVRLGEAVVFVRRAPLTVE